MGGAYLFHDLRADDARLTLAVLASAAERGARVLNHARCRTVSAYTQGGRTAEIETDGGRLTLRAAVVVNATGVWAGRFLQEAGLPGRTQLAPAKGAHLVLPAALLGNDVAVSLPVPGDRRTVSVVRQGPFCFVGSTDSHEPADVDAPGVGERDVDYVLRALNRRLGRLSPTAGRRRCRRAQRRPVAPPPHRARGRGPGHGDRRQAHHLPRDGGGHGRPGL
ncbi:FAD-dependent oxidoreductase [Piscinibacter sakaiensis]|uniref:FAD-dependent oxidoreductase n=1 Tax=Piscinibacter sakaiensis TaxID=1547922 RepID=UPI00372AD700